MLLFYNTVDTTDLGALPEGINTDKLHFEARLLLRVLKPRALSFSGMFLVFVYLPMACLLLQIGSYTAAAALQPRLREAGEG